MRVLVLVQFPRRALPAEFELMPFEVCLQIGIAFDELDEATQCPIEGVLHPVGVFRVTLGRNIEYKRNVKSIIPVTRGLVWHSVLAI